MLLLFTRRRDDKIVETQRVYIAAYKTVTGRSTRKPLQVSQQLFLSLYQTNAATAPYQNHSLSVPILYILSL